MCGGIPIPDLGTHTHTHAAQPELPGCVLVSQCTQFPSVFPVEKWRKVGTKAAGIKFPMLEVRARTRPHACDWSTVWPGRGLTG